MAIICNKHGAEYELNSGQWSCPECKKASTVKPPPEPPTVVIDHS